jgi:DNA-binding Lrp family transcriptional regulator
MSERINASQAAELRRMLKRQAERALSKIEYYVSDDEKNVIKTNLAKTDPAFAKAIKVADKINKQVKTDPYLSGMYDHRPALYVVHPDFEKLQEEFARTKRKAGEVKRDAIHAAIERAEDEISLARIDGSVDAETILANFLSVAGS